MANHRFSARYEDKNVTINVTVNVISWVEDRVHFFYAAPLDLTGYGETEDEARHSFETFLHEFVEYTHRKGTVYDELEKLGWMVNKKKRRLQPPSDADLLNDNEEYRTLMNRSDISTRKSNFAVSL